MAASLLFQLDGLLGVKGGREGREGGRGEIMPAFWPLWRKEGGREGGREGGKEDVPLVQPQHVLDVLQANPRHHLINPPSLPPSLPTYLWYSPSIF